jgi:hypothetical protein
MPDQRRRTCRVCGHSSDEVGPISWRGKCEGCAQQIVADNVMAMIEHRGPQWTAWRRSMATCVGASPPPDIQEAG